MEMGEKKNNEIYNKRTKEKTKEKIPFGCLPFPPRLRNGGRLFSGV